MRMVRKFDHKCDSLSDTTVFVDTSKEHNKPTHIIMSMDEFNDSIVAAGILAKITSAEIDRRECKRARDMHHRDSLVWKMMNRQLKTATMRRLRAINKGIKLLGGREP